MVTNGLRIFSLATILLLSVTASAKSITVPMFKTMPGKQQGAAVGEVRFVDSAYGMLIYPNLHSLPPGPHGFHVHEKPECQDLGMAAGGHYDPAKKGQHRGPYSAKGHLGDLPLIFVDQEGKAAQPLLAPRLRVSQLKKRALVLHEGGDTYSDVPKMGGGGARIACGVFK